MVEEAVFEANKYRLAYSKLTGMQLPKGLFE